MNAVFGSHNGNAKLSEDDARQIYKAAHGGELTLRAIAEAYGVSHSIVHAIKVRAIWSQATAELEEGIENGR